MKRVPMNLEKYEKHVMDLHSNSDYLFSEEYSVSCHYLVTILEFTSLLKHS